MSVEAAISAAMRSMQGGAMTPTPRWRAVGDVASAWALMTAHELDWLGASGALGSAVWGTAIVGAMVHLVCGFARYASYTHAMVDGCALAAAAADRALSRGDAAVWALVRPFIRLALLTRVCAASALCMDAGTWAVLNGRGVRGVFHRLEHAGAVNIAVCVSVGIISLGPVATAQHRLGAEILTRYFHVRVDDEVLRAIKRMEQVFAAAAAATAFNALFNLTRRRLLGRPLQGIIETLEYHAKQVLTDLELRPGEVQSLDIGVLGYVLDKMSHIVKRNESDNGGPALIEAILEDHEDVDGRTREWLVSYEASNVKYGKSASVNSQGVNVFKSVVSSFARMSDAGGPYLSVDGDALNSWSFDVFTVGENKELFPYVVRMFHEMNMFELVDQFKFRRFLSEVEGMYRDNPYHCFKHAVDVTHTTYLYICAVKEQVSMTQVEIFSVLVAALVHDLDHPGVTNGYLIATRDNIALTYNDESVLENLHLSRFFSLCQNNEDANILSAFDESTYKEIRRSIISCVLHTDMAHHFKLVSRLNELVALGKKNNIINGSPMKSTVITSTRDDDPINVSVTFKTDDERQLMLNVLLHCADISNAVKPNELCVKWASRVLEEFFNQGDRERSRGMSISPMMDRETTSVGLSQINFIEFVIAPLYVQFVAVFPALNGLLTRLIENRRYYQETYENELADMTKGDGTDRSPEKESLRARFRTLIEKHSLRRFVDESDNLMKAILSLPHTRRSSATRSFNAMLSSPSKKKTM